jgi:PhzF family phenazine biosynthesis protein
VGPTIVDACTLRGRGGSPTAVFDDDPALTDAARRDLVRRAGTSHGAFLALPAVRFFTAERELVNCGHGTVAAQAVALHRRGGPRHRTGQRTGGRTLTTSATRHADGIEVWFEQGAVDLRPAGPVGGIVAALGLRPGDVADGACIASPGTPRLLLPVRTPPELEAIRPDFTGLAAECRRLGLLGCFVYAHTATPGTVAARMFAPAIGVAEDVVNANSSGCLAAHLAATRGDHRVDVLQGATLGRPSLVSATVTGGTVRVGGVAVIRP